MTNNILDEIRMIGKIESKFFFVMENINDLFIESDDFNKQILIDNLANVLDEME